MQLYYLYTVQDDLMGYILNLSRLILSWSRPFMLGFSSTSIVKRRSRSIESRRSVLVSSSASKKSRCRSLIKRMCSRDRRSSNSRISCWRSQIRFSYAWHDLQVVFVSIRIYVGNSTSKNETISKSADCNNTL